MLLHDNLLQKGNLYSSSKTKRRKEITEHTKQNFPKICNGLKAKPSSSLSVAHPLVFISRRETDSKQRQALLVEGGIGFGEPEKGWKWGLR